MLGYLNEAFIGPAAGFMYALLAVMAFGMATALERAVVLFMRERVDLAALTGRLEAAVAAGRLSAEAPGVGQSSLERVVAAGLAWTEPELAWEAMTGASIAAEQRIRQRISYLATIASIATMLGLFGTVYGLILAFGGLGDVAATERAARLSEGSSTAMATTAFGLLVAIPAMGLHAWLDAAARSRLAEIEQAASRVMLLLRARAMKVDGRGR